MNSNHLGYGLIVVALLLGATGTGIGVYNLMKYSDSCECGSASVSAVSGSEVSAKRLKVDGSTGERPSLLSNARVLDTNVSASYTINSVNESYNAVTFTTTAGAFVTLYVTIEAEVDGAGGSDAVFTYTPPASITSGYVEGVSGQSSGVYIQHNPGTSADTGTSRTMVILPVVGDPLSFRFRTSEHDGLFMLTINLQLVYNIVAV